MTRLCSYTSDEVTKCSAVTRDEMTEGSTGTLAMKCLKVVQFDKR
jgi:hypothetical protein